MKFIRFGDSLLNLEQVVLFVVSGSSVVACFNGDDHATETTNSNEEAQARFKELSDYLVDEKHLTTKSKAYLNV